MSLPFKLAAISETVCQLTCPPSPLLFREAIPSPVGTERLCRCSCFSDRSRISEIFGCEWAGHVLDDEGIESASFGEDMTDLLRVATGDMGTLELPVFQLEIPVPGREPAVVGCRSFKLPEINGLDFETFALTELIDQWAEGSPYYAGLRLMTWHNTMMPNKDRRKGRNFDVTTFERCESLRELTLLTRTQHASLPDRLMAVAGERCRGQVDSFDSAAYERPQIRFPGPIEDYEQFRDLALQELVDLKEEFEKALCQGVTQALRKAIDAQGQGRRRLNEEEVQAVLDRLSDGRALRAIRKRMGSFLGSVEDKEEAYAKRFCDVVEKIDAMNAQLVTAIRREAPSAIGTDGKPKSTLGDAEYVSLLERTLSSEAADKLLGEILSRIEQDHDLVPLGVVELDEYPEAAVCDEGIERSEPANATPPAFTVYEEYQQVLTLAIANDELSSKWDALCQMRAQLVNRTEYMRLFHRECEMARSVMFGHAVRVLYQRIREHLTKEERRMFLLLYFPNRWLKGRVAAHEPLGWCFLDALGEETAYLLYLVLVQKKGNDAQRDALERRWHAFLRFYPHWLEIVRFDEREGRRLRSDRAPALPLIECVTGNPRGRTSQFATDFKTVTSDRLPDWVEAYCTPTQSGYLLEYFRDGRTEAAIAGAHGVSQQAVHKGIKSGLSRLRKGLLADGKLEVESDE